MKKTVKMDIKTYLKEHAKLIDILKHGSTAELKEEAKEQANEVKRERKKK